MKAFKTVLIVFFILSIAGISNAQSVYFKLGGGYGLGLSSQYLFDKSTVATSRDLQYGSFGQGIDLHAGVGYMICKNWGFELAGSFVLGNKFEENSVIGTVNYNSKHYANTISIMPAVVVSTQLAKEVDLYSRFGMTIAIPMKYEDITATGTGAPTGTMKWKESGGVALGINGAVGTKFILSKNFGIFTEIFGTAMSWGPSTLEVTEKYANDATVYPKITYEENWTPTAGDNKAPKPRYALSNFGLRVGVTYFIPTGPVK